MYMELCTYKDLTYLSFDQFIKTYARCKHPIGVAPVLTKSGYKIICAHIVDGNCINLSLNGSVIKIIDKTVDAYNKHIYEAAEIVAKKYN